MTIKVLGYSLSNSTRDGGMDMEYLTKLQDIMGADLRCMPLGANIYGKLEEGQYPETAWQSHFSYEWSEQSMFLDFSKSLCPEKLFYDSSGMVLEPSAGDISIWTGTTFVRHSGWPSATAWA